MIDLGQNINGWLRLANLGPAGTTITLTHGEWSGPDGDVTTDHLKPAVPFLPQPLPAGQVDSVVSAGVPGEVFEPRHTTHGFQYVRVEGHPDDLTADDVRGVVVHTDMRRTGWFSCSDERMDPPARGGGVEPAGQRLRRPDRLPAPGAGRLDRRLAGVRADRGVPLRRRRVLHQVAARRRRRPVAGRHGRQHQPRHPRRGQAGPVAFLNGSAGWGDAVVIVPWEMYRAYGDTAMLHELWPAMVSWLDRAELIAATHGTRPGRPAVPKPQPHEKYLWDSGFHWGEWLEPGGGPGADFGAFVAADKGDVATAYFAHSAGLMARIAGCSAGTPTRRDMPNSLRTGPGRLAGANTSAPMGRLTPDTQANHVRALAFDLVPAELRSAVADRLVS